MLSPKPKEEEKRQGWERNRERAGRRIAFEPVLPFVFVLAGTSPATINVGKVYLALMVLKPQVDNVERRETKQSVSLELMKREDWNINSSCVCNVIKKSRLNPNYEQTSNGYSCFHFLRITKKTRNLFFYSRWNLLGCNITPGKINTYRPGAKKFI